MGLSLSFLGFGLIFWEVIFIELADVKGGNFLREFILGFFLVNSHGGSFSRIVLMALASEFITSVSMFLRSILLDNLTLLSILLPISSSWFSSLSLISSGLSMTIGLFIHNFFSLLAAVFIIQNLVTRFDLCDNGVLLF